MTNIFLKPKKEESILRFHPWVFSGAIAKISGNVQEGDLVRVLDCNGSFLAIGHYQIGSIAVRILSFNDENIDRNFFQQKIKAAYLMRKNLGICHCGLDPQSLENSSRRNDKQQHLPSYSRRGRQSFRFGGRYLRLNSDFAGTFGWFS